MDNEKDIEFIDNFLAGKLNNQEVEDFNKRLSEDPAFKKEYELLSGISASFNRIKLKNELADLESKIQQEEKTNDDSQDDSRLRTAMMDDSQDDSRIVAANRFRLSKRLAIAATIATIIVSAYFIYQNNNQTEGVLLGAEMILDARHDSVEQEVIQGDSSRKEQIDEFLNDDSENEIPARWFTQKQLEFRFHDLIKKFFQNPDDTAIERELHDLFSNNHKIHSNIGEVSIRDMTTFVHNEYTFSGITYDPVIEDLRFGSQPQNIIFVKIKW